MCSAVLVLLSPILYPGNVYTSLTDYVSALAILLYAAHYILRYFSDIIDNQKMVNASTLLLFR